MTWRGRELGIRLGATAAALGGGVVWEATRRARPLRARRRRRWAVNLGVGVLDAVAARLIAPMSAVGVALVAERRGWGLMNRVEGATWARVAGTVAALDLLIYGQHVALHRVGWLRRWHVMHHTDVDMDATTALRFHPVEILLSLGLKAGAVVVLGAPAGGVLLFEVLLNATALFNHANARLPPGVERWARRVVVTPDMHRVHHSTRPEERDSNFGFNLPWWDRLFGTYRAAPRDGHEAMALGARAYPDAGRRGLWWALTLPLRPMGARARRPMEAREKDTREADARARRLVETGDEEGEAR